MSQIESFQVPHTVRSPSLKSWHRPHNNKLHLYIFFTLEHRCFGAFSAVDLTSTNFTSAEYWFFLTATTHLELLLISHSRIAASLLRSADLVLSIPSRVTRSLRWQLKRHRDKTSSRTVFAPEFPINQQTSLTWSMGQLTTLRVQSPSSIVSPVLLPLAPTYMTCWAVLPSNSTKASGGSDRPLVF